MQNFVLSKNI